MFGKEALVILANLSQIMAAKMKEPIYHMSGWINSRFEIIVARLYSRIIRGSCLSSPLRDKDPDWESGSVMLLAQKMVCQYNFARTHKNISSPVRTRLSFPFLILICGLTTHGQQTKS